MGNPILTEALAEIPIGTVQTFLCADPVDAIDHLEVSTLIYPPDWRLLVNQWHHLVESELVIKDALHGLAENALRAWPKWYGHLDIQFVSGATREDAITNEIRVKDVQQVTPSVSAPWLRKAIVACQHGQFPLFRDFSRTLQFAQLALVLDPKNLILVLVVHDKTPADYRLLGFAKVAAWIAQVTNTRVAALIPNCFSDHPELDSILYGAIALSQFSEPPITDMEGNSGGYQVSLIRGKPHHSSDVEQKLYTHLLQDSELGALFGFNQTVEGTQYKADLLWQEGKVVVELDGDDHRQLYKFNDDRHRDYELLLNGYLVLRLPNKVVSDGVDVALHKIRNVVRFRRNQLNPHEVTS